MFISIEEILEEFQEIPHSKEIPCYAFALFKHHLKRNLKVYSRMSREELEKCQRVDLSSIYSPVEDSCKDPRCQVCWGIIYVILVSINTVIAYDILVSCGVNKFLTALVILAAFTLSSLVAYGLDELISINRLAKDVSKALSIELREIELGAEDSYE